MIRMRTRTWAIGVVVVAIFVGLAWKFRQGADSEGSSVAKTKVGSASGDVHAASPDDSAAERGVGPDRTPVPDHIRNPNPYPLNLDALRSRLPNNRYWTTGAPTSDPVVAKARAARAEADNVVFGRIQTGEASPDEIRAYYAERRAISRDYIELAVVVLEEKGGELPDRDRAMFELSANLHRDRLKQIDRDETDALARHDKLVQTSPATPR